MASRDDQELKHRPTERLLDNRRRLEDAKGAFRDVAQGGGDGPQRDRAIRPPSGPQRTPKLERGEKDLTGGERDFELVAGKSGKAITSNVRIKDHISRDQGGGKGRSDSRPSTLRVPMVRPLRLATPDGRTSFHFSHDSVSKTRNAVVSESGQVNRPGAARAHGKYIERDSAVAHDDGAQLPEVANDVAADGMEAGDAKAVAVNDNESGGVAVDSKEPYFEQPLTRSFLRAYRSVLGTLLADPDPDPRGAASGPADGLRDLPGGGLVPDGRAAEMLLWADEVPVVGRDGAGGAGLRRAGDEDRGDRGGGPGRPVAPSQARLGPVPARLSRPIRVDSSAAIAALDGLTAANDPRTAEGQGRYIERQEALAVQPDGARVLFTNIDPHAAKRAEFWQLVEQHEYEASPDRISFTPAGNQPFWDRVAASPDCPRALREALAASDPFRKVSVEVDDNVAARRFLSTVEGWPDTGARRDGETLDGYRERAATAPCRFHDGRGGRIQYRIIGELPHELDVKGRSAILKTFSEEFERKKLPYVAVMHAPDHTNSDKNWHFHLVYYDRPCRRLTAEDVAAERVDENPKNQVVETATAADVGKWDFTVPERYKTGSREIRTRYPFAQKKDQDAAQNNRWIETLRLRLAEITNDHLMEAGIERRVDHRRHSEMGIHNDPQEHLGTKLANLEAMGIPTPKGVSNEERQWEAVQRKLDGDLDRRRGVVDKTARRWIQQAERAAHLDDGGKAAVRADVARWHQHRMESEEHLAIAENLDQHVERATSRARKVMSTCDQHLKAIGDGKATKYQAGRAEQMRRKSDEAFEFVAATTAMLAKEVALSKDCRALSDRESLLSEQLELTIERALAAPRVASIAEEKRRRATETAAERKAEAERIEAAGGGRRALNKEAMDAWLAGLLRENRRIVLVDRKLQPLEPRPEDREILDSINYKAMQNRLSGIKRKQDAVVADVVAAVAADPRNVVRQRDAQGRETDRYVLVTPKRTLAHAFRDWQADPAISVARDEAARINAGAAERDLLANAVPDRKGRIRTPDGIRTVVPAPSPSDVSERPSETVRDAPRTKTGGAVAENPSRAQRRDAPSITPVAPGTGRTAPVDAAPRADRTGLAERRALDDRIVAAIKAEGRRIVVADGTATLAPRHMEAVGATVDRMSDPAVQKRLVELARVQDRELRRLTAYARAHPARLAERDGVVTVAATAPREIVEIARRWRDDEMVALTMSTIRAESRAPDRAKTGAGPATRDDGRTGAGTPDVGSRTPAQNAPAPPSVAPAPSEATEPPTPVARPTSERITDLAPDLDMREQARADAERRRVEAEESKVRTERPARAATRDPERAVLAAAARAATAGAHPLIDRWREALTDGGDPDARRRLALEIEADREAREKLRTIDRQVARRIRDEAQQARDERQPGLGLDVERGLTPRR